MTTRTSLLAGLLLAVSLPAPARAEVVAVAGKGVPEMTREQLADIFMGKTATLPGGGAAKPVDLPESSSAREEFYTRVTGKTAAQVRSVWSRLAFTGKGALPPQMGDSAEVKRHVAATAGSIGYIDRSAVDDTVKIVWSAP